jgi:hypothetical protein
MLRPGSYIRLSSVSLNYTFDKKIYQKLKLQGLKLYVMGNNLFTITKYPGYDPETGMASPMLRLITGGVKVAL